MRRVSDREFNSSHSNVEDILAFRDKYQMTYKIDWQSRHIGLTISLSVPASYSNRILVIIRSPSCRRRAYSNTGYLHHEP